MGDFERYRRLWEQERANETVRRGNLKKHHISAKKFFAEMTTLKQLTNNDPAFDQVEKALDKWGLVTEEGDWKRNKSRKITMYNKALLKSTLNSYLARGRSLRSACAVLAWECDIRSATFQSAVDYLKHIHREPEGTDMAEDERFGLDI